MRTAVLERGLWGATVVAVVVTAVGVRAARATSATSPRPLLTAPAEPGRLDADSIAQAVAYVVANDPFRLSRHPATVAYSPALEGLAPPAAARPPRPNLVLRGVVGGPPWSAILDGVPGRDGSVLVRRGDSLGTLIVRAVGRDTVTINGADTTWRLTVKRSW
jgi:hypothetical protein